MVERTLGTGDDASGPVPEILIFTWPKNPVNNPATIPG